VAEFPGMSKAEARIWREFLKQVRLPAGKLYYNVRVGRMVPWTPGESWWVSVVRSAVSRTRADALLATANSYWLFEVKTRAGLSAVGQALGYAYLFSEAIAGELPVLPVIVCDRVTMDVSGVAQHEGVGLFSISAHWGPRWIPPALTEMFPHISPR